MKKFFVLTMLTFVSFCFSSCNDDETDEPTLTPSSIALTVGQTKRLIYTGDTKSLKWSSNNPEIATVSSQGVVKAWKVGSTVVKANALTCSVVVNPNANENTTSSDIKWPLTSWGATPTTIKSAMVKNADYKNYYLHNSSSTTLSYASSNLSSTILMYVYMFENLALNMSSMVAVGEKAIDRLTDFVIAQSTPLAEQNGIYLFLSKNGKDVIGLTFDVVESQIALYAMIMPYTKSMELDLFKSIINAVKQITGSENNEEINEEYRILLENKINILVE